MMRISELKLLTPQPGFAPVDFSEWAIQFYETAKVEAPPLGMRVRDWVAPVPTPSVGASIWRGTRAERNTRRTNSRRDTARLPGVVVRALIVYSLGMPVLWFALMDLILFFEHGVSLLGPAMDAILMVFGFGLCVVSVVAFVTETQSRKRALSQ